MKTAVFRILVGFLTLAITASSFSQPVSTGPDRPIIYPETKKVDQVDDYHGTKVADPYRWLEDLDSPETEAWVKAQNKVTFAYLEEIPARGRLKKRLTKLWNYEKYTVPVKEGGRYFFRKNDGLQNQYVLYTAESLGDKPRVLLDPNTLSADGTIALAEYKVSPRGRHLAYALSDGGSDWRTVRVRKVDTAEDLTDELRWVKFTALSWTRDGSGFFYSRYDEPKDNALQEANFYQKLFFHRLGTPQTSDTLVYQRPDQKDWGFSGEVTDDGRYLIVTVWEGTERKNRVYYKDLNGPDNPIVKLLDDFDAEYGFIDNDGPVFWFQTDLDAPRYRVIAIDTGDPARDKWREIIPQAAETLRSVNVIHDRFVASYLKDARTQVRLFDSSGRRIRDVEFSGIGTASGFPGKRSDTETFYSFMSFRHPPTIYRYDMTTGKSTVFKKPKVDIDPDRYVTKQVFYNGKDGTRIPMFITHKKGLKLDGKNPTYLYGYGGFNISLTPRFRISNIVWLDMGGVFAQPNIRGGGEYGKAWHNAGRLKNKQNCFDDFIAAAEWLIDNKYTSKDKLAIGGGSNGGLLVGACITQRPDLFAAALPAVGVLDMLRFDKFTIGHAWKSDYGLSEIAEDFKVQYAYSPLHNVKPGTSYPATMITTGDHDDRVVPSHSFKFASTLQAAHVGKNPVLIRIETRAGHGAGKPTWMIIEEQADRWGFLVRNLGIDDSMIR